ncbi:Uncharacterised protein [Plesiomonas shigelloides]|uniref:hypothetical protein n=1 Tax=Plesiomonas shigelloides TaxID=703 RepID=UPI0007ECD379|nr:hypothetical protein [Plesiomonas shigelloides]SBT60926.1 Uncharacterised protein [Plesiomonas shigelloides]
MSLMRMNYVKREITKLSGVIKKLIENYHSDYKEYDERYSSVKRSFIERKNAAQENKNFDLLYEINIEEREFTEPCQNLKSLAQFQNELMLVKHVALVENMIVNLFWCLTTMYQHSEYKTRYFSDGMNFSDSFEAASKINEMTNGKIALKKYKFWYLYETMKTIRNVIAHGDPLFVITLSRVKKFNNEIDLIQLNSEKNECVYTMDMYPSKIHPSYNSKSKWYCSLKNDLHGLIKLNEICFMFVEDVRNSYIMFGKDNGLTTHEIYGCTPIHPQRVLMLNNKEINIAK